MTWGVIDEDDIHMINDKVGSFGNIAWACLVNRPSNSVFGPEDRESVFFCHDCEDGEP